MRITRAAKVAAFPLTVLILVALVACQGPAGPGGADGKMGGPGTPGTPGTPGAPGTAAFQAKIGVTPILLNVADLEDKNGRKLDNANDTLNLAETATMTIDLGRYFIGGTGEGKYEIIGSWGANSIDEDGDTSTNTLAAAQISAEVKGTMLEYTLTLPTQTGGWEASEFQDGTGEDAVDRLFTDGFVATVRGTGNDTAADATVAIVLNRKPMVIGDDIAGTSGVVDASENALREATLTLGIQDIKRRNPENNLDLARLMMTGFHKDCATIHECVLDVFSDDGDITVTVESMTRNDLMDTSTVGWSADGAAVTLTGMASTWDKDRKNNANDANPGHAPVTVKLKATDTNGESNEVSVLVAVNGPPTLNEGASDIGRSSKTKVGAPVTLTTNAPGLFAELEGDGLLITAESSNTQVATVNDPADTTDPTVDGKTDDLIVTGVAAGPATITLTATSDNSPVGMFQTVSMEFTVTVE